LLNAMVGEIDVRNLNDTVNRCASSRARSG